MSSRRLEDLHPQARAKVDALMTEARRRGLHLMVTATYRSFAEQDALYAQGRTEPGPIVTNARGGQSFHNVRRAADFAFVVDGKPNWSDNLPWLELGRIAERCGLEWGGRWRRFPDRPHVEDRICHLCGRQRAEHFTEDGECGIHG